MTTPTPRADEVETKHGLAWFGLHDEQGRYLDGMVKFRELSRQLERDLAAAQEEIRNYRADKIEMQAQINGAEMRAFQAENSVAAAQEEAKTLLAKLLHAEALLAGCSAYLKDGETPVERIQREIADCAAITRLYAAALKERDAAQEELERVRDKCNEHYMALAAAQREAIAEQCTRLNELMVGADDGTTPVIRRIGALKEQLALAHDAINDALPWMIKLGDYIGNGTQADPMGRCNAILKMRIAVEKRDD